MKLSRNTRINVRSAATEEPHSIARFFDGIWLVVVANGPSVMFVPAVKRDPWPPELPENTDLVQSNDEARRLALLSEYAITADDTREGTTERIVSHDGLRSTIAYCTAEQFATATDELSGAAPRTQSVHDSIGLDELCGPVVAQLLALLLAE